MLKSGEVINAGDMVRVTGYDTMLPIEGRVLEITRSDIVIEAGWQIFIFSLISSRNKIERISPEQEPAQKDAINPHEAGAKLDAGKVRPALVIEGFSRALLAVSEVGTFGADKYTDNGWQHVLDGKSRYTNAMYRHLLLEATGEVRDAESNLAHAAHAAWNAIARLELMLREGED